jgi:3-oxoacyl-[acyl-carrier protein] reductase
VMSLEGRVAIVTGGGRGIGRAISLGLAADGAQVAVNFRKDEAAAADTVAAIESAGGRATAYQADVASFDDCTAMVERIIADFGHVDVLVNNAGITNRGTPVGKTPVEELERVIATMAFGSHHMSQLVLPSMREQPRGDIVMVSSQSAVTADPYGGPYNMAKAAQEALAFTLAKEEAKSGIRVNVVVPGLSNTDMGRRLVKAAMKVDEIHELNPRFPLGRVCEPEDVAGAVRFLAGPGGSNITGQRLVVDGGGFK